MNLVNLITVASFVCVMLLGVMVVIVQDMRNNQPPSRIRQRMQTSFAGRGANVAKASKHDLDIFHVNRHENAFTRWTGPRLARLRTVAGANGLRIVIVATLAGELVAVIVNRFAPMPDFLPPLVSIGLPALALTQSYRFLVERFRKRFLDGFPDVIDMIVRAVRAGVPVTQVIGSAASECREPLKSEFQLMADSLQVGLDLEEVLAVAMRRIEIADFSFFCVCLLLQRETGGQLGETLENLSGIVRTRREIRQKTKALTGEARITTKILAAIPVVIMGSMYALNRDYLMVLFNTDSGNNVLTFGVISIVVGLIVIGKMSKLDTSR
ncbi:MULTISPECIES: type II secretion system F family protein [Caballeronia]|jgi:Flp pilus assembly protein TadB|uniref:Pilus assembly protein n=1 Tax=Caballeronia zhejiangensis TaxID=871203 RepID=A0A656QFU9_9BURK|nr:MULTISPECIES: type II secretion system F family protein [Caballeronia]EKS66329.1 type II secretion system protein [Burkholderia sp. SJ98]KDR28013.1 pilus assembly protein [Caballeronia zhejiangensis]MDR5789107.1 type II secretion system F family protein [Caballeronia sp. LP003]